MFTTPLHSAPYLFVQAETDERKAITNKQLPVVQLHLSLHNPLPVAEQSRFTGCEGKTARPASM